MSSTLPEGNPSPVGTSDRVDAGEDDQGNETGVTLRQEDPPRHSTGPDPDERCESRSQGACSRVIEKVSKQGHIGAVIHLSPPVRCRST